MPDCEEGTGVGTERAESLEDPEFSAVEAEALEDEVLVLAVLTGC